MMPKTKRQEAATPQSRSKMGAGKGNVAFPFNPGPMEYGPNSQKDESQPDRHAIGTGADKTDSGAPS